MKFAVIGAGIAGLGAAWLLKQKHDVTLFEAEARLGGHANTLTVEAPDGPCAIDTGFIVYNTASYPNLIALFERLDVPTAETSMSFAVSLGDGGYEYSGSGLSGLFGQASNFASPAHWRMVAEIFRFFREASAVKAKSLDLDVSLKDWLAARGYSERFVNAHIVPMAAAIWSTPSQDVLAFPFASFARFFENHGLLQAFNRPAWRTVVGGSRAYVERVRSELRGPVLSGDPVVAVQSLDDGARVQTASGRSETFDGVLLACHADDALNIVASPDGAVADLLRAFRYADNVAALHSDAHLMPKRRNLWSSWNYISASSPDAAGGDRRLSVSYWMNRLQPLSTKTDYFVTLNPERAIASGTTVARVNYRHPMFDAAAMSAQLKLWPLQGRNSLWFAGSYLAYGFHEDGLQAGLAAAEDMSLRLGGEGGRVVRPWPWDHGAGRIAVGARAPSSGVRVDA
ncbi:MAG: NAD(P)/FAD-dependent oxidoreductase [Hyphomicrobium sp.]